MANKMLIDATHPEETRVVVLRGNRVEEFDFETAQRKQLRGNIYLAKVTRVEPSLQAAFVEYGGNRHGFLAFSEIHPDYYQIPVADRQALLEDEERAHREEEEDEHRGRRRGGGRNRQRESRQRRDETVHSDPMAAEHPAGEHADIPAGENGQEHGQEHGKDHSQDHNHDDAHTPTESHGAGEAHEHAHDYAHPAEAVGETANPPVEAEVGTEVPAFAAEPIEAASPEHQPASAEHHHDHATAHHDDHDHDQHESEHAAAGQHDHADHDHEGHDHADHEHAHDHQSENGQTDGHAGDEEEEVVESVGGADAMEEVPDRAPRYRRQYKIQEVIKRRQVMLVQVVKEERGTKGAALTTYLSLAGRYCVLMPNTARGGGISRKITSAEDRKKLREIAEELEVPEGMGVILRTAGAARTKAEVKRDFEYLLRMWETVRDLTLKSSAPTLVYEEGSLAKRSIRDLYSKDIEEIVVAGEPGYRDAKEFMRMLMPSHARNVKLYQDSQPVFTRYGIESQLDAMFSPTVQLRSGGYIVINQTEALVAIDVNSGRSTREHHIEDTAVKTNIEAAEEVARQLRLRDLAGLIVIDFIDMDEKRNNRTVERRMKEALRHDRARIQVGRISHFGLLEMSRQRIRTSVLESSTEKCPHCGGSGHMRSVSSVALQLLRGLEETMLKGATHNQIVRTRPEIALYVLNNKRAHLSELEERFCIAITVNSDPQINGTVSFTIDRGEQVMTLEQAKEVAARAVANAPKVLEEEEPEIAEDEIEETGETFGASDAGGPEEVGDPEDDSVDEPRAARSGADDDSEEAGSGEREGGERDGSRRRRRRRGRGGAGRDQGPREHRNGQTSPHADAAGGQPGLDGEAADAGSHGAAQPYDESSSADEPDENGESRVPGETAAEGEQRRRRRGRRGGRRNRRDRPEAGFAGPNGEQPHGEGEPAQSADVTEQPRDYAPPSDIAETPRTEPVAAQPFTPPAPSAPVAAPVEAPRRRSTVREAAPTSSRESAPAVMPAPPQEPAAAATTPAPEDAAKPRRTGWWAKRLLGGNKS